jgi:hypothetical protein
MRSTIEIDRPVEEVFAYIEDGNRSNDYLNGEFQISPVRSTSHDGRYRLGSLVQGQGVFLKQRFVKLVYRVEELKPNRLVTLKTIEGDYHSVVRWVLHPVSANRTYLSLDVTLKPVKGLVGMLSGLMKTYLEPVIDRYLGHSLLQLKGRLEHKAL